MREFLFDDENEGKMTITVTSHEKDTYVTKHIKDIFWPEILKEFVFMLNGCGYIIDPVKAEKYIDKLKANNGDTK